MLDLNAADWITVLAGRSKVKLRLKKKGAAPCSGQKSLLLGSICPYPLAHYCFKGGGGGGGWGVFACNAAIQPRDHHNPLYLLRHGAFYRTGEITAHLLDLLVHQCLDVGLLPDWHLRASVENDSIHRLSVGVGNQAALQQEPLAALAATMQTQLLMHVLCINWIIAFRAKDCRHICIVYLLFL